MQLRDCSFHTRVGKITNEFSVKVDEIIVFFMQFCEKNNLETFFRKILFLMVTVSFIILKCKIVISFENCQKVAGTTGNVINQVL